MRKMKFATLTIVMLIVVLLFNGCGEKKAPSDTQEEPVTYDHSADVVTEDKDDDAEKLKAVKIGATNKQITLTSAGLYYKDGDRYGIIDMTGKSDTGAKYTVCKELGNYFDVATTVLSDITDISQINCHGLVDAYGNEVVPMKYASIKKLNERFVRVYEVTDFAASKDTALLYYTERLISLTVGDDDLIFNGNWYVYDTLTGKQVNGVRGTRATYVYAYGNIIQYTNDQGQRITVDYSGRQLPDDVCVFDNGYYCIESSDVGSLYDTGNNKLFDYNTDECELLDYSSGYIVASLTNNGITTYVLMDDTGKTVSTQFEHRPEVYGKYVLDDRSLTTFDGTAVVDDQIISVYVEDQFGDTFVLKDNSDGYILMYNDDIVFRSTKREDYSYDEYDTCILSKKENGEKFCFSIKDKDFTIKGSDFAPNLVCVEISYDDYDLVDIVSGKKLLHGYADYDAVYGNGTSMYIAAENSDGSTDIFEVK